MCERCDDAFELTAEKFDEWLTRCRNIRTLPRPRPPTTAERVHDRAVELAEGGHTVMGNWINAWYLALAVERLLALEESGIST